MIEQLKRKLLEQYPVLDAEEDGLLLDWLPGKYESTLRRQGVDETLKIAAREVEKYPNLKAIFLRELRELGLDLEDTMDRSFALKLWDYHGYSILAHDHDVYHAVREAEQRVDDYLDGQNSTSSSVADADTLASRFSQQDLQVTLRFTEKQRQFLIALSEFFSTVAQLDYRILKFRRDVLGGSENTISYKDATNLVRSPAAQRLSLDFFTKMGIPVVGHTAKRMPVEDAPHSLYVEPPPRFVDAGEILGSPMSFRWIGTNGVLEEHSVADSSVLGELLKLCKRLTKWHAVTEELAACLVLCGGTVQLPSLYSRVSDIHNAKVGAYGYDHSTITLTVASWVSPEQVRQEYAKLRAQASAKNTYRSKSDRNIAVFRFVMERAKLYPPKDLVPGTRGTFKFPRWKAMVKEWNKSLPDGHRWRFDQSDTTAEKMFRNAFADGYEVVTGQKYYRAKPLTTKDELREEAKAMYERLANSGEAPKMNRASEQTSS